MAAFSVLCSTLDLNSQVVLSEVEVEAPVPAGDQFDFALWIKAINLAIAG
jgi:hypothetical protein